jgi:hypothetical protein
MKGVEEAGLISFSVNLGSQKIYSVNSKFTTVIYYHGLGKSEEFISHNNVIYI